ncbi:MAG: hypothetical protein Kow006_05060 [Gammaproteobacteria bacterium]
MSSLSRPLLIVPLLLVVAVVAAAAWKLWPILHPEIIATADSATPCDLHQGPCTMVFDGGVRVTLSIEPRPVKVMEPLTLTVETGVESPWSVEVDFTGVSMNMGYNRPLLKDAGEGLFTGETMLPTCIRNEMEWQANVLIRTARGYLSAPYRFTTVRNG